MAYYDDDDLRDFVEYSKDYFKHLKKDDPEYEEEGHQKVEELVRIIMSFRYNSLLFEDYIKRYTARDYLIGKDLKQLPLHINDEGLLSKVIIKWRLQRNK